MIKPTPKLNHAIRARRIELGIAKEEIVRVCGFTAAEYDDIEGYADELLTVTYLQEIRCLCKLLRLNIFRELGLEYNSDDCSIKNNERHIFIKSRREELGISDSELTDKMGFVEGAINKLESNTDYLETWPLELIIMLAEQLKIDPVKLIT
jgi:DNA-binding XRE family transcriptional regulator